MKKLITLLFVLFCFSGFGQVYQLMPQYGYQANRFRFDSTLQIPTVCGVPTLKSNVTKLGAIAFDSCNNRFYTYNPKTATWSQVSGGGGSTDTTSLSARINLKIDSVKRRSDSVFAYRNGTQVFQFKDSVGTNPAPVGYYGAFQDTITQTAAAINTAYPVKLRVTDLSNQVTISNESKIKIANAGIYNIQFSLQLEKTGGSGNMIADIWLRKNGTNINGTTGKVVLTGSANASPIVAAWNYVISVSSNDSLELMWSTDNDKVVIKAAPATSPHPSVPSAILTVTQQSGIMAGTGISPSDTATMLTPYLRKSDTATMLTPYLRKLDTASLSTRIDARIKYTDSATMLTPYLRKTDTASLSTRIVNSGLSMVQLYRRLGSATKSIVPINGSIDLMGANFTMTDGNQWFYTFYLDRNDTLKGVRFFMRQQGVYTADNYNGVALYTMSGGTLTLVDSSTNDGNIWKATANAWSNKDFVTPYYATEGFYVISFISNWSAQTTLPILGGMTTLVNGNARSADFSNGYSLGYNSTSRTNLFTSVVASTLTYIAPAPILLIY